MTRDTIRFLRRGTVVELGRVPPMATLLDHLRLEERARGTKEGCGEGDCGACTVALGSIKAGRLVYEPVNSCIVLMGQVDGKEVVAVDDLARSGRLHPVQEALVDCHGSQCGFCTPGFVMSLFTLYQDGGPVSRQTVLDRIAGNLCRCTGYRPIVDAALASCGGQPDDACARATTETESILRGLDDGEDVFVGDNTSFLASPASITSLAALYARHSDATLVGGATDVGLWITKQLRDLPKIIVLHRVEGLSDVVETDTGLTIGAAATYADAETALARIDPDVAELIRRLGSVQVRASGTIGGNIANGSPIGDSPPMLIALGARLDLQQAEVSRSMPLEEFFIAYGRQDREPGEFVRAIHVPKLDANEAFRCYKITKRFDQDISSVLGAYTFTLDGQSIAAARIAYGGMAATPKRAAEAEAAIIGARLDDEASWLPALDALGRDYAPIDDHRASAEYRRETARALLLKALHEVAGTATMATRVMGVREMAA